MKAYVIIIVFLAACLCLAAYRRAQSRLASTSSSPSATKNVFADLRVRYFVLKRSDVSILPPKSADQPWGVIMEIGYPEATLTTVAFAEGTASVLRSAGGGFFGGGDESVQKARKALLEEAELVQPQMALTSDFPLAEAGQVIFYLRTDRGVYTTSVRESELSTSNQKFASLYQAGLRILHSYLQLQKQHAK